MRNTYKDGLRGDTITIQIIETIPDGAILRCQLRQTVESSNYYILDVVEGVITIPSILSNILSGSYVLDVECTELDGTITTIQHTDLTVSNDITKTYTNTVPSWLTDESVEVDELLAHKIYIRKTNNSLVDLEAIAAETLAAKDNTVTATNNANIATENANTATNNANTATGLANTATSNANTAKDNAIAATTAANTATSNANTATTNANTATGLANTAKDNAIAATTAANTAKDNAVTATSNANTATSNANTARDNAIAATTAANTAKDNAVTATNNAVTATSNANTATGLANTATSNANTATSNAITAKDNAVTATNNAVTATSNANTATGLANTATSNANAATTAANTAAAVANIASTITTVALPAYDIDMLTGFDFTKTLGSNSAFTISNPVIKKPFRLILIGGSLVAPSFSGYTATWILGSLLADYNPAITNYLWCEIRSAGQIYLFWGA